MESYQANLEQSLEKIERVVSKQDAPWLLLSHLIMGTERYPHDLRRSAVWISESSGVHQYARTLILGTNSEESIESKRQVKERHRIVHNNFISYMDRENTFLDYVIRNPTCDSQVVGKKETYTRYIFGGGADSEKKNGELTEITFSSKKVEQLFPYKVSELFFRQIYGNPVAAQFDTNWSKFFRLKRSLALTENTAKADSNFSNEENVSKDIVGMEKKLAKLAGIQSAVSYMGSISRLDYENDKAELKIIKNSKFFVDTIITPLPGLTDNDGVSFCVTMIARPPREELAALNKKKISAIYKREFQGRDEDLPNINEHTANHITFSSRKDDQKEITEALSEKIEELYDSHRKLKSAKSYCFWNLMILEKILGELHEGKKLDFFFVCGELSLFSDKTILRQSDGQKNNELNKLKVPGREHIKCSPDFTKYLEAVSGLVSKEHYPWFEDGRHALFWDLSDTSGAPLGLVKLKHGNWKQVTQDRVFRKTNLNVPECMLFYSLGREESAGLVHARTTEKSTMTDDSGSELLQILQWHGDKWEFGNQENKETISTILKNLVESQPSQVTVAEGREEKQQTGLIEQLSSLAYRVSIEKDKGGTIIVLKPGFDFDSVDYTPMGKTLKFQSTGNDEDELIDRINLIAHDGASIVCLSEEEKGKPLEWMHRGYLLPSATEHESPRDLITQLLNVQEKEHETHVNGKHPLSLKGTRRWAAAVAALNPAVGMVIVISQDGDIHIWGEGGVADDASGDSESGVIAGPILLFEIPRKGQPFQWDFDNGEPNPEHQWLKN